MNRKNNTGKIIGEFSHIFVQIEHVANFETDFEPRKSISNENKNARKIMKAPKFSTISS